MDKSIKTMTVAEIEELLEQRKQAEAQAEVVREQVEVLESEREIAQRERDAALSSLNECKKQFAQIKENIKHTKATLKSRQEIVSQKENAIRELTANVSFRERSEGFGERTPETVILDTIRSIGEPVSVSRLAKRILADGLYKGKNTSSYIATHRTVKSLLEKGQIHPVENAEDKREKMFMSAV